MTEDGIMSKIIVRISAAAFFISIAAALASFDQAIKTIAGDVSLISMLVFSVGLLLVKVIEGRE